MYSFLFWHFQILHLIDLGQVCRQFGTVLRFFSEWVCVLGAWTRLLSQQNTGCLVRNGLVIWANKDISWLFDTSNGWSSDWVPGNPLWLVSICGSCRYAVKHIDNIDETRHTFLTLTQCTLGKYSKQHSNHTVSNIDASGDWITKPNPCYSPCEIPRIFKHGFCLAARLLPAN